MSNKAERKTISTIGNFFFEIPPYQRLYEWEKEQIETLLEDVKKAQVEKKKVYFIGNVVVSKEGERYILIDGQQRLTTLFLIGIYLASKEKEESESWSSFVKHDKQIRISMPLRENEEKWLLELINKGEKFRENLKSSPSVHKKIFEGLVVIQNWFDQNTRVKDVFSSFLYEKVRFALIELAEGTDLNQFFVRMNNRGKQLEKHEILKVRLLGILQKGEWQKYAKIWDLCSDMDKYIFQSASDRKFLNNEIDRQEGMKLCEILEKIEEVGNGNNEDNSKDDDDLEKVKSIIDFPTFLLHVAKLTSNSKDIPINKDKLLESIVTSLEQKEQKVLYLNNKEKVEKFIFAMLKYRILFDYFVIKRMVDERLGKQGEYAIKRLYYNQSNKSYTIAEGNAMENLAKIQNYLRVARAGDKQNYHHWLTPFLSKVAEIDEIKKALNAMRLPIQKVCKKCESFDDIKVDSINKIGKEKKQYDKMEGELIKFLENLDTDLAIEQTKGEANSESELLGIANNWLKSKKPSSSISEENFNQWASDNLNQGTGTPHYWFYRLEYYLWKNRREIKDKLKINNKSFDFENIASNYRFRGLNSIEHIQPQSKVDEWENDKNCKINDFGNLALISQSFNSSLSNQDMEKKWIDIRDNKDVESLKMCLAYASVKGEYQEWNPTTAKKHQDTMLKILKDSLKSKGQK